nr:hypothetical protein [Tanacetum cinerariifolium]
MLDSGCSRYMTGNMSYQRDYEEIDEGYVAFGGFTGKETPLFPTMVGPNQVQMGEGSAQLTDTQHTPTFDMPPPKPKKTQKPRQPTSKTTKVPQPSESTDIAADELENKHTSRTHKIKRLYKVGLTAKVISSSDDEALDKEDTSKQGRIDEIDADKNIALEEVVEVVTIAKLIIDIVVDDVQVTTAIADILVSAAETIVTTTPTITAESTKTNVEESTKKDEAETAQESSSKRERDELKQERSKKQKMEDDKESVELKKCLEIVPDDGDTVTIDAIPLSSKSPTIVNYKIYKERKKSYIQIFRADGNF